MGECGCGDQPFGRAIKIGRSKVTLGVQIFTGCEDCDYGPGVAVSVFDSPDVTWLEGVKPETIHPDEFGGKLSPHGHPGFGFSLFDVRDLEVAARELWTGGDIDPEDGYENLADWLHDNGARLIQIAMRRYEERMTNECKTRKREGER